MKGLRGPEAQLWADEPVDGNGKPTKDTIFKIKLTSGEQCQELNYLKMKYERKSGVKTS
jgi:hypothetical protein